MTQTNLMMFRQTERTPVFGDLDRVALLVPTQTDDGDMLPAGSEGTVLTNYQGKAYVIEFPRPIGALATVAAENLTLVERAVA